ncbi:MAG: apolipoprotein N-acyltransferase [Pseudomonadales bacterium]|nr:apolipoprotein N-acyltransferase [Pseudomonadales bacterium]
MFSRFSYLTPYLLLIVAGCGITLSLAPFDIAPAAIAALMVLYHLQNKALGKQIFYYPFVFSAALFISGCYWIYISMNTYGGASPPLALLMTLMFCLFLALLIPPFLMLYKSIFSNLPATLKALAFASLWLLSEWLRTWFLTGFPWMFIGYSQTLGWLNAWAPIIGTLGISFLLAFSAALLMELIHTVKAKKQAVQGLLPVVLLLIIWLSPLALKQLSFTDNKSDRAYKVALIQPDISLYKKWNPRFLYQDMQYHRQVSNAMPEQDIILWAETAVAAMYHQSEFYLSLLDDEAKKADTAIILGIPSQWLKEDRYVYHNSMIGVGKASGIYHKQKLVPFGEYVPFEKQLRGLIEFFDLPLSEFRPGPANQEALIAKDLKIMPYICYEIVYPDFVAKTAGLSDVLLTVSNDAWFGDSIGPLQHLQMVQMRAIETGRYILRGTNTGVTAVINHRGQIIDQLPQFERGILKSEIYAREGLTPMARFGSWPVVLFSIAVLLLGFIAQRRR